MKYFYISKSNIHGFGLFAQQNLSSNLIIGLAFNKTNSSNIIDNDYRYTFIGRYINHSQFNNIDCFENKNGIWYFTIKEIIKDSEILMDYTKLPIFEL